MKVKHPSISGFVKTGFEEVKEAFTDNFEIHNELGAACCIFYRGEKVVDLWGGVRNKHTGESWEENTMVVVFSTTKGLAGLAMAVAHSKGYFNYEDTVSEYWPEFERQGKSDITIRQLLSHQAGLYALDVPVTMELVSDLDKLSSVLARQKPVWKPGIHQAYHAITLGFYESELLRRVDFKHRSLGEFFQDEISTPLSLDAYIRLPENIPNSRLAILSHASDRERIEAVSTEEPAFGRATRNPRSRIRRALDGSMLVLDPERIYARNLEIPSGGGVASAAGIARAYSVFATGGHELEIRQETLQNLMEPAIPPRNGFHDECLKVEVEFSLGFMKPSPSNPFGHPSSFGAPGSGGSFGFADPANEIGYAYVTNQMGMQLQDPRDRDLRQAMYSSIGIVQPYD